MVRITATMTDAYACGQLRALVRVRGLGECAWCRLLDFIQTRHYPTIKIAVYPRNRMLIKIVIVRVCMVVIIIAKECKPTQLYDLRHFITLLNKALFNILIGYL